MPLQHHPVLSRRQKKTNNNNFKSDVGLLKIESVPRAGNCPSLQKSECSLVSVVSSDNDAGSETYFDVKDLFRDTADFHQDFEDGKLEELCSKLANLKARLALDRHPVMLLNSDMNAHFKRNYGSMKRYNGIGQIPCSIEGLDPEIPVPQMISLLKAQEKYLALKDLEAYWNSVRPPKPNWWADASSSFSIENSKNRKMLSSRNQAIQFEARQRLFELHRELSEGRH